ncbi:MAG: hypothetical protein A3E07_03425 [Candidatus Wildermuthbacteria bacterium RIFCSPHIGHO2_12_FULL_45_9]|uniref:Uncharacterized protein n=1 Tax=Candidatus Wildermuthbacteria bacterium RIFCSPHIGHO2_02_FULL_45_25 TaxID=1802450 RepID=A0A1G2QZX7_9BACT|nr:MAG: hypothetical protein A3C04_03730 [Candidatus Wildermuthbacteria bacterium RIFCSPHIGHO2_02_FULL_45_25]OHA71396.1 MAG: hypothetical protein A3E07_03425 [Candidatus Wildermuthbacteria bacterium RIFCSPHIGHO2_12_FULL_45_9]
MENNSQEFMELQKEQLNRIEKSVNQMKTYFRISLILTVAMVVLPLVGLLIVIPQFISLYSNIGI